MKKYHVVVKRQNPDGKKWTQEYNVEAAEDEVLSVMNILENIYQKLDPTLAYFDHAACHQAACGKCTLKVNGKVKLACKEIAAEDILLEPASSHVIRDLICGN